MSGKPDELDSSSRRERVLFVCTANRDRSPTAEDLYANDPRYAVRSAGTWQYATTPITRELVEWADRIFVMCEREDRHRTLIVERFPDLSRPIVDLDLPDRPDWRRGYPALERELLRCLEPHLGKPDQLGPREDTAPPSPGCGTREFRGVTRLFVVGDVQANYDPLSRLLEAAGFLDWDGETLRYCSPPSAAQSPRQLRRLG